MSNFPERPTEVLLADDHPVLRLGLKQAVCDDGCFTVVAETGNGQEAYELIRELRPAVALLDWDMPGLDGLEVLKRVKEEGLPTRVAILTLHNEESLVNAAVKAGVDGFILKDHALDDILKCLKAIQAGQLYLSPSVSPHLTRSLELLATLHREHPEFDQLTRRQKKILSLVTQGLGNKEIAERLEIGVRTVESHRAAMCSRLGLKGSHSLIRFTNTYRSLWLAQ